MVTLPQLSDYSEKELNDFKSLSPIYSHYLKIAQQPQKDFPDLLRAEKHKHWLECAFATIADTFHPEEVCNYWSHYAEKIVQKAWYHYLKNEPEVSILAFGKLGSNELNLSSDIDLAFVKNSDANYSEELGTKIKNFIRSLSEVRNTGFAFRVDTSIRPGGESSPLVLNQNAFFNFYDSSLEAWHRISFVRMRPITGDHSFNQSLLEYCQRLSFPRRLDYSIINDIKGIRSKLQKQWKKANEPLDIKFIPGGIRDIELYIQSLQVIYGGHKLPLRTSSISLAMKHLLSEGVLSQDNYNFLFNFYWKLRKVENHIHGFNDQHTYRLTKNILTLLENKVSEKELLSDLEQSNSIVSDFFTEDHNSHKSKDIQLDELSEKSSQAIKDIKELKNYSLKKAHVETQKNELLNKYMHFVNEIAIDKDLAIQTFRDFIFSIKSKSSVFFLLNRQDSLLENIAWLFSFSPYIGNLMCQRPELMDSYALGAVDIPENCESDELLETLIDYKLLGQIVATSYLLKNHDIKTFCQQLTVHADFIAKKLLDHLSSKMNASKLDLLCLGKWSGHEIGIQSDLDFVFTCEKPPEMNEIKVAKRFINFMTNPTKAGKLYNIDMRLKPNESAGPLLLPLTDLKAFLDNKAQAWQKQAYMRSRTLSDNSYFYKKVEDSLQVSKEELEELKGLHLKLIVPRDSERIDIKYSQGGLVHTEFAVQVALLKKQNFPETSSTEDFIKALELSEDLEKQLIENYNFIRLFEQIFQICMESSSTKVSMNHVVLDRLGKVLKISDPFSRISEVMEQQNSLLKSLDATT